MVARKVSQTIVRHREEYPEQHRQSPADAEDAESENAQSSSRSGEESDTSYLDGWPRMISSISAVRGSELSSEEQSCAASPLAIALLFALLMVATQVPLLLSLVFSACLSHSAFNLVDSVPVLNVVVVQLGLWTILMNMVQDSITPAGEGYLDQMMVRLLS